MHEVLINIGFNKIFVKGKPTGLVASILIFALMVFSPRTAFSASSCLQGVWDDNTVSPMIIYPNWSKVLVSRQMLWMYAAGTAPENIKSITVINYGSAGTADIKDVYVRFYCGATSSGTLTLTYAGVYNMDSGSGAAWTWTGTTVDFSACVDMCGAPFLCGGFFSADIMVDIQPCPTAGRSIRMGFPTKGFIGSVYDNYGCVQPTGDSLGPEHTIQYLYKVGPDTASPGDTVDFTVYYGKPGTANINPIVLLDTIPQYMHYVTGSGVPAPDAGWDPNPSVPAKLRWTLAGPFIPAGGATAKVVFSMTVDWGNGESFEPGSGDVGAPEGWRINNTMHATYTGTTCPGGGAVSNPAQTTVKRFMMWLIGDNDVLFSPSYGQSPDEIIYSVFVKNISSDKTWWDVRMWDTVPPELDVWGADCGFDDPCSGWTMTPSGCAAAGPGRVVSAGKTILTWKVDMPPQFTIGLRWKAKVSGTSAPGNTAVNVLSVKANGRPGIVDGTGSSGVASNFAHLAPIILPTTYISYVSWGVLGWDDPQDGDALSFFPLNKKAQFELRGLSYTTWGPATGGAVSASIGCLLGDCIGGFPGSPGCTPAPIISGLSSQAGCKAERIPARWHFAGPGPNTTGHQHIYKITSNCPVNWQCLPAAGQQCADYHTYAPSTTLSYVGLLHYFQKSAYHATMVHTGTSMFFMNVGKDPYGNINTSLETTVHIFRFDYTTLSWEYQQTMDLAPESAGLYKQTLLADVGPYRSISSQGQLIAWQGYQAISSLGCGCPCYDDSTMMPTRESGNVVGLAGETFYGVMHGANEDNKCAITNVGAVDANYRVYRYVPDLLVAPAGVPAGMAGTSGKWLFTGNHVVPAGYLNAGNPKIYSRDSVIFDAPTDTGYKVELISGGPIQIMEGARISAGWGGGAVVHASTPPGGQTGSQFWVTQIINDDGTDGNSPQLYAISVFCSKTGMAIQCETSDAAYSATFTTTGPDQCVSFMSNAFDEPARARKFRITRLAAVNGDVLVQYMNAGGEKGYTAPFLQTGVHYAITMPPVVFIGQNFWITVAVLQQGGATKTDYVGTSSFTSSDPGAKLLGLGMAATDYTWILGDAGVKIFINVSFSRLGLQSIVAVDTTDGSISGVAATMVVGADIKLEKRNKLSVAASGDTVQFRICWSNYSTATGYSFTITDAIPRGTDYVPELSNNALCGQDGPATASVTLAQAISASTTPPNASFTTIATGTTGSNTARWLRWTVRDVYVNSTGCVCFKVLVQ